MKKITLQMIAETVGVSKALVSKALSNDPAVKNETKELIWQTATEMGYRFDNLRKSISYSKTGNIAVLMPQAYLDDIEYWGKIIRGIDRELATNELSMMLSGVDISQDPEESLPRSIHEGKVDGALLLGHIPEAFMEALEAKDVPFVLVDANVHNGKYDHILANNFLGAYDATSYLLHAGHRHIAFVGDSETALSFRERERGFEEAMKNFKTQTVEDVESYWVRGVGVSGRGNYVDTAFPDILRETITAKKVTGFFCANDRLAIETLRLLNDWHLKCPEDYSIVGFDDISLSEFVTPMLTTVRVPKESMGSRAVQCLQKRIQNHQLVTEQVLLTTELVERDSVGTTSDF
ncbi:LacI family DNA-binding transcriptional regulator [Paenibacillus oryzisoli]|uniref:Transcriptional regulator n=1 Tax=Paenibacillus oryzisoli TaxID=1850517 RepID=A0A198A1V7_9BACL|nr:LacI family DNA-binding transcriptional regulator [Paenibacillus oryzisoli]OAS15087.1 transcriptional regulator [Paenibacillus oryzisoli]